MSKMFPFSTPFLIKSLRWSMPPMRALEFAKMEVLDMLTMELKAKGRIWTQKWGRPFVEIAEEHIRVHPNPDLSNEEHLNIHAEVIATMDWLGASYKDAANHLYLAKVAKLKAVDLHKKGLANESQCMQNALIDFERKYRNHVPTNMNTTDADFCIGASDMARSGKKATGTPEYDGLDKDKGRGKGKGQIV
ncbi:hypothetical protein CVT25_004200 [Psilocybe cyanescens]|uniref:Uncharacterized protein n=1 Tax=Psilocybe cyanescens TaxID=93625 RepID=A0A409X373_PSICY|nr:hypothetical protein CVT25_004200 [Psilocybe cyanescens]